MARPVGRRGETRERIVTTAMALFAEHGAAGTSLQMIADALGVTKAAVYHQFRTKEEIVQAVVQPALDQLDTILQQAQAFVDPVRRRDLAIEGLVDVVLDQRRVMAALLGDPAVADILNVHPEYASKVGQVQLLLFGPDPSVSQLIAGSMVGGGLMTIGLEPRLADTDRDTLRRELLAAARRLLHVTT
jgi:AcrR family transcriptional regulator